ncbi:lipid II:glycine glycyltransferase FemX [Rhodoplanes azumiensis]|uniref:Lipid II:glycine glycyltransferase FemX n=1 Tax=Rhodoplanes azumiensis TaxID=1897628 RepID=A0ABW5AIQ7_9BRAD
MTDGWAALTAQEARRMWDDALARFDDGSPFQSLGWGEYQRKLGWEPVHYVHRAADGAISAMCLLLLRRYPAGIGFAWCVGGPVGDPAAWAQLRHAVRADLKLWHLYFRFRSDRPRRAGDIAVLQTKGWSPAAVRMGSSLSMALDLSASPDALLARVDAKWRRNLRLARKEDVVVEHDALVDPGELRALFAAMEQAKGLPELFSREKLAHLLAETGRSLVLVTCRDRCGTLIAARGAFRVGGRACDYFAAANAEGRRRRAAYLLLWELIGRCREAGIVDYDLGGIDPEANPGVYEFKRLTGATRVEFLGEWDWATSALLRRGFNELIRHRRTAKRLRAAVWPSQLAWRAWRAAAPLASAPCIAL